MDNRMSISLDKELDDAVEAYKYQNRDRLKTKNKAISELLRKGMDEFNRRVQEEEAQKNKAPTAESAAEALYEVLYYYLERPPAPGEVDAFRSIIPVLCNGINGAG